MMTSVLIRGGLEISSRGRPMVKAESDDALWRGGERPEAEECEWPLAAGKGRELDSSLEPLEGAWPC